MAAVGGLNGQKLYARIAGQMRALIEGGTFQPGSKLPPLAELAEQFGCSRASVREALGALRGQGLIEFRHGDGTYVRAVSVDMWMEPLEAAVLLSIGQAKQLVELEAAILAAIAGLAAERAEEAGTRRLSQALFALECARPTSEEAVVSGLSFYLVLAELSGNPLLENALRVLQEALRSSIRLAADHPLSGLEACRRVMDAVQMRDPRRARDVIYEYGISMANQIEINRRTPGWRQTETNLSDKL